MTDARIEELNRRIRAKLAELEDDRAERRQAQEVLGRREARIDDVTDELRKARRRIKRRREALAEVRDELKERDAASPGTDTPEEVELRERRDELAGELEEALTTRDLLLARLDRLADKHDDARRALKDAIAESQEDRDALERMRRRRDRIKKRLDRPSEHFTYPEFDCNDGTPLPAASEAAVRDWCQRIGEPLRDRFGTVTINSAFRPKAYNASIGGEPNSVHIYDYPGRDFKAVAVDIRCERGTPADWYAFTAGKADGRGLYTTFHHADTRNRIGWPDATWRG